jgi:hypothetical protein
VRLGSRARLKQPGQLPAVWTVTEFEAGRRFVWETRRMWMRLTGVHVVDKVGDRSRNRLEVELVGAGSGLLGRLISGQVNRALASENAAFKAEAENGSTNA